MNKNDQLLLFGVLPAGIVIVVLFTMWQTAPPELVAPVFEESSKAPPSPVADVADVADELQAPVFVDQPSKPLISSSVALAKNSLVPDREKEAPIQSAATSPESAHQPSAFPTEERIWTNLSGKIMLASALDYDAEKNVLLLRNNKGELFPNYAISKLSAIDRKFLQNLLKSESRSKN